MTGTETAAAAILDSRKNSGFPVVGYINTLHVARDPGTGVVTLGNLSVRIDSQVYTKVTYSGAFLAEILATGAVDASGLTSTSGYIGRAVVIEKIGTQMNVAYSINIGS